MGVPANLLPHTVTRVRAAESTDAYNNVVRNYGTSAPRTDMAGWLQQDNRAEPRTDGRDADTQLWLLITNDDDIAAADRIEWTGPAGDVVFEVEGPPAPVYAGASYHHLESSLRVVAG